MFNFNVYFISSSCFMVLVSVLVNRNHSVWCKHE